MKGLTIFGETALAIQGQSSRSWNEAEEGIQDPHVKYMFCLCLPHKSIILKISSLLSLYFQACLNTSLTQLVPMGCAGVESVLRTQCWAQSRSCEYKIPRSMVETLSCSPAFCLSCNNSREGAKCVKQTYLISKHPPQFSCVSRMLDLEHTPLWCPLPYLRKDIAAFNGISWRTTKII